MYIDVLFLLATGRCEDPLLLVTDDSVIAVGYCNLTINGTVVTFSCPPGLMLNGPKSVMCTHTGQWEPSPSAVNCSNDTDSSSKNEYTTVLCHVHYISLHAILYCIYCVFNVCILHAHIFEMKIDVFVLLIFIGTTIPNLSATDVLHFIYNNYSNNIIIL